MFVPRKPWPFGNEYHTICCAKSGILWALEIVEGKDAPPQVVPEHNDKGKTVGLLLRLTQLLYATGKVVILDSGFCVLQGILELAKRGVFASALIKKRRFWPKYIPGDELKAHFESTQVGTAGSIHGQKDGVDFDVYCLKEPDYTMMIMSTYGTNMCMGETKKRVVRTADNTPERIEFQYPEVIHNHYQYRHCVDDHNASRHAPISIEATWATKRWECRVFAFLLAVSEVNCMRAYVYFMDLVALPMLDFRLMLATALLNNCYVKKEKSPRRTKRNACTDHEKMSLPKRCKFDRSGKIVRSRIDYPQRSCNRCKQKKVRQYCKCNPGYMLCPECFSEHLVEEK
jgi:hypothetical protein